MPVVRIIPSCMAELDICTQCQLSLLISWGGLSYWKLFSIEQRVAGRLVLICPYGCCCSLLEQSLMRILDTVALYMPKSISFPVVFLSLTVGVLYSLRIMNSGRRKYFKYIKQVVRCSHVSRSGWHFRPLIGILFLYLNKSAILGSWISSHEI